MFRPYGSLVSRLERHLFKQIGSHKVGISKGKKMLHHPDLQAVHDLNGELVGV